MVLLLHTSTPTIRLGIADGERVVARDEFPNNTNLTAVLADRIARLVQRNDETRTPHFVPHAVHKIVVHAGPGGYTTLRVGVTTANALAYALGLPVIGVTGTVNTLEDLLARSNTTPPSAQNFVIPFYAKPPDIGPAPH